MTYIIVAIAAILIGYLSGSFNYAIPITKMVIDKDIRSIGNHNPGTSNVLRNVGKGWGVLVGFLDGLKGLLPIIIFRIVFFKENTNADFAILYLIGIAAVLGHCKSIFLKFTGGGGIGTMLGVSLFFIPMALAKLSREPHTPPTTLYLESLTFSNITVCPSFSFRRKKTPNETVIRVMRITISRLSAS